MGGRRREVGICDPCRRSEVGKQLDVGWRWDINASAWGSYAMGAPPLDGTKFRPGLDQV